MNFLTRLLLLNNLSLLFLLMFCSSTSALPRPTRSHKLHTRNPATTTAKTSPNQGYKTLYYPQTLDHFNYQPESYRKFKQKYVIDFEEWGGAESKSPMLVYLGDESALDDAVVEGLVLKNYGRHFRALLLYIEHRFYGESIPFGISKEKVMKNARIRGYFSSAQAIADYAELILHIKEQLNAHYSPVIVIGGSYGGMLASWFRLKYPHVALGALASSAPVLFFDNIIPPNHGFYSIITKDFQETSQSCYKTIKSSWKEIDEVGQMPNGLSLISEKFNTCAPLKSTSELKDFLQHMYTFVAQYNLPPITAICNAMDNVTKSTTDILDRIYAGVVAFSGNNQTACQEINWKRSYPKDSILGWEWQTCSEMVMPMVFGTSRDSMFPRETFNLTKYIKKCKYKYGIVPRPHWITTYYGGHDMKLILKNFGSNIIFSNGLRDPYSSVGVLGNLSNNMVAISTNNGTHTMDIIEPSKDDPEWLILQRRQEIEVIDGWLRQYYANLKYKLM